jgi:hypothetical protein
VAVPKNTIAVPKQKKLVPKRTKFKVPKKVPKRVATVRLSKGVITEEYNERHNHSHFCSRENISLWSKVDFSPSYLTLLDAFSKITSLQLYRDCVKCRRDPS